MSLQDIIDFAISNFPQDPDSPQDAINDPARRPYPDWLPAYADEVGDETANVPTVFEFDGLVLGSNQERAPNGVPLAMPAGSIDALAYYLPYHFYPRRWGIYYLESGIIALAEGLKGTHLTAGDQRWIDWAHALLYQHERFHFLAECAATSAEIMYVSSIYRPYFDDSDAAELEEALANALAVEHSTKHHPAFVTDKVRDWMDGQGPGYHDYAHYVAPEQKRLGRQIAVSDMVAVLHPGHPSMPRVPADFLFPNQGTFRIPQYLVLDAPSRVIQAAKRFPKEYGLQVVVHTKEHEPPHIHIHASEGSALTKYTWPDLAPMPKHRYLTGREKKHLDMYLDSHAEGLQRKLQTVYRRKLPPLAT